MTKITRKQKKVLKLRLAGKTYAQIALSLKISTPSAFLLYKRAEKALYEQAQKTKAVKKTYS